MNSLKVSQSEIAKEVGIPLGPITLTGDLILPADAKGLVLFAHGSGRNRHGPRNQFVARAIRDRGIGTLLFDLLTLREEEEERWIRHLRFDIELLAERLMGASAWAANLATADLCCGYFVGPDARLWW